MLNLNQQKFVDSKSNYLIAQCPAGSGKTFAMVEKIAALADQRVHPRNILCITFTRAAGVNLRDRAKKKLGEDADEMFANTFHSFAIKVITENARHVSPVWEDHEILNGKLDFTIYDQLDRADICKAIIKRLNLKCTMAQVVKYIYAELDEDTKEFKDAKMCAKYYEQFCIENIALDLDNLINMCTELLKIKEVRANYDYEFVMVDEFQDSNNFQNDLLKALNPKRLVVIGDPNQSIYAFNRAKIEYILNFKDEWPDVEQITFTDNYRSTQQIVDRANEIVSLNTIGTVIDVVAHSHGDDILLHTAKDFDAECEFVYREIISKESVYKDHAVLCRTNALASGVAEYLKIKGLPVNLVSNSEDPFKLPHVRQAMKFIQFCINLTDSFAFSQWINFPKRRMSDFEIQKAITDSMINEQPIDSKLSGVLQEKVKLIQSMLDDNADKVFFEALQAVGAIAEYATLGLHSRLRDFDEANEQITKWQKKSKDKSVKAFIKWLCIKDIQEKQLEEKDAVTICTIHGAKGLEWRHCYIMGVTEGIFPNTKKSNDIDEERRIMYVAMTRPMETCTITCSEYYRTRFGQIFISGASEFYKTLEENINE